MEKPTVYVDGEGEKELPYKMEVCERCKGEGSVALPGVSFTQDEMEEMGEDFLEDYLSGVYDSACPECQGLRVVAVVDREKVPTDLLALFDEQEQELWDMRAMEQAERNAGA